MVGEEAQLTTGQSSKERILETATRIAQAHGYGGLNYRDLAEKVGIKAASIYHHFPSKADLAAAVAKRYWQTCQAELERISASAGPISSLEQYPGIFRTALVNDNRVCLASFMSAEYEDLPEIVRVEVKAFAQVNIAWLKKTLIDANVVSAEDGETRAEAIYAAVSGAQLFARGRANVALYDGVIKGYQAAGLLPVRAASKKKDKI
jgi:TetR/AcrR family transcriptional repressor of nem operon